MPRTKASTTPTKTTKVAEKEKTHAAITIRIPLELKARIDKIASRDRRSFNQLVNFALEDFADFQELKKEKPAK